MRPIVLLTVVVVATFSVAGCSDGNDSPGRSSGPSVPPTPATTTTLSPEGEVRAALDEFLDVLTRAYYDLDPAGLDRVASGERLATIVAELDRRRAEGRPMRLVEDHRYEFIELGADRAVVRDRVVNRSVRLDPVTRQPTEAPPSDQWTDLVTLERSEGTWKVVVARAE